MKKHYVYNLGDICKVGVTQNPQHRIETMQGYSPWKKYVIAEFLSADQADTHEKDMQQEFYDYYDKDYYPSLLRPIKIVHTGEATCTCNDNSFSDIDEWFEARTIEIHGPGGPTMTFEGPEDLMWLSNNKEQSRFNTRPFWRLRKMRNYKEEQLNNIEVVVEPPTSEEYPEDWTFDAIRKWAHDKKLYGHPNSSIQGQALKLGEEFGETQKAVLKGNTPEIIDGIGDCVVVLTSLAELAGVSIEDCIQMAWTEIRTRKGTPTDKGDFLKY